jgi:hypothetical protein
MITAKQGVSGLAGSLELHGDEPNAGEPIATTLSETVEPDLHLRYWTIDTLDGATRLKKLLAQIAPGGSIESVPKPSAERGGLEGMDRGGLLTAGRSGSLDLGLRRRLQRSPLPREPRKSNPADVYFGRGQKIPLYRERIKRQTISRRGDGQPYSKLLLRSCS